MVGENLEFYWSKMATITFKLSMIEEILEFHYSEIARIAFKTSTIVGENLQFIFVVVV